MGNKNLKHSRMGMFDFYPIKNCDCKKGYIYHEILKEKSKEENPKPFLSKIDIVTNATGSADGRIWIPMKGNLHGIVGFPESFFKTEWEKQMFPMIAAFALRDGILKYAPGQFMSKFPNDVVCKEHRRKTAGLLTRNEQGYVMLIFGANLVTYPDNENLRKESYGACCLKNHADYVPSVEELLLEIGHRITEMYKIYTDNQKILDLVNTSLNEYEPGNYKLELNNPKADLKKDGTFWTTQYRNALFKVHHDGFIYQYFESYFDKVYYKVEGNPDEKKPYHIEYEYVKDEDLDKEIHNQKHEDI